MVYLSKVYQCVLNFHLKTTFVYKIDFFCSLFLIRIFYVLK